MLPHNMEQSDQPCRKVSSPLRTESGFVLMLVITTENTWKLRFRNPHELRAENIPIHETMLCGVRISKQDVDPPHLEEVIAPRPIHGEIRHTNPILFLLGTPPMFPYGERSRKNDP